MRTILDLDYSSLCLSGQGDIPSLRRLFGEAKRAGFDSILWAPLACGKAYYPSKVVQQFRDHRFYKGGHHLVELLDRFDPLEEAVKLAAEFEMELLFYFRLLDDYYPGLEEDFFESHPELYWQSRCGYYQFKGWPCYHYGEVREHKMRLFRELLAYGPDGFMVEVGRSHSYYVTPHRAASFFGYNAPIVQEFERRYGVNIREYDYMVPVGHEEGYYKQIPFSYSADYINAREFDVDAWHWLKGEAIDSFMREMSAANGDGTFLMSCGICPLHPIAADEACAKFYIDANKLAADGVIDGYSYSGNFRAYTSTALDEFFFPYFDGVRESGKMVGAWLNDIMTADGGHGAIAPLEAVERYVEKALQTSMDYVVIHEADFIARHPQREEVWNCLGGLKERSLAV